jgi:hypothetical protein
MRLLCGFAAGLIATSAHAQGADQLATMNAALELRRTEEMGRHDLDSARALGLETRLNALDAQIQTDQRLLDLRRNNLDPALQPPVAPPRPVPTASLDASRFPSIPDKALAESRARILAASRNRR